MSEFDSTPIGVAYDLNSNAIAEEHGQGKVSAFYAEFRKACLDAGFEAEGGSFYVNRSPTAEIQADFLINSLRCLEWPLKYLRRFEVFRMERLYRLSDLNITPAALC